MARNSKALQARGDLHSVKTMKLYPNEKPSAKAQMVIKGHYCDEKILHDFHG